MNPARRAQAYQAVERATEMPMLVLSYLLIPVILSPVIFPLPSEIESACETVSWIIWALFALELAVKLYLTEHRGRYLLAHWFDVLIVILPLFRPLRIARSVRAVHALKLLPVIALSARLTHSMRIILRRHGLQYSLLLGGLLIVAAASAVTYVERDAGGTITSFQMALWWAAVTVTTVGYGDAFPVTPEGRGIGVLMMCVGIALFSLVTASISAFFVESQQHEQGAATLDDVMAQLRRVEEELAHLREVYNRTLPEHAHPN